MNKWQSLNIWEWHILKYLQTNNLNADYILAVHATVQNHLSSYLLSENIKTVMYKNLICAAVHIGVKLGLSY
jgi:hypothetical protein